MLAVSSFGRSSSSRMWTPAAPHSAARSIRAAGSGTGTAPMMAALTPGAKVRVSVPLKVWHVAKFKEGLELQGMEGTVLANVAEWKGKVLSASLPWKVQFEAADPAGSSKPVKVIAHLAQEELEVA